MSRVSDLVSDARTTVRNLADLAFEASVAARSFTDYLGSTGLRLGVTGLSRAGKTVFISAFIQNLIQPGRLPVLRVHAEGRLVGALLEPQPDDAVPRFACEDHLAALTGGADGPSARHWPQSTSQISELRLTVEFARASGWRTGNTSLTIDIVDYPGEWLLDLPLLAKSYAQWSAETLEASAAAARAPFATEWRAFNAALDPAALENEETARIASKLFIAYLRAARDERYALSTLPPGRFLMPGDLAGSPALTFAPLSINSETRVLPHTMAAMMERRYEAYKNHVVRPFFGDHFARLDRQIVLVDVLAALNSGPDAVRDLETAMSDVLTAFRTGRRSIFSALFRPRIDKILFAATKADHLHHTSHDRLEAILRHLTGRAIARAESVGADIDVIALAAVRATREARVRQGRETIEAIVGTPIAGERIDDQTFDGETEAAIFPGELPSDPSMVFRGRGLALPPAQNDYRFVRFRPPVAETGADGKIRTLPHIRL
ncbi:MAG TPA: YcjX family protein, partial [Beijerinckiaceae bacterium]|nr:YcjX family protein [Beijerinckiaceae bacterium]